MSDLIRSFGLCCQGSNHVTLKKRLKFEGIEIEHHKSRWSEMNKSQLRTLNKKKLKPLEQYLVEDRMLTSRSSLKARLIREGLLQDECHVCGLTEWMGNSLTLDLHHKNGISMDNRLENLSLLCPNCHRQTKNFAGKNRSGLKPRKIILLGTPRMNKRKVQRPSKEEKEELADLIANHSWTAIGKQFGVSDNAVRKWAKSYGLLPFTN